MRERLKDYLESGETEVRTIARLLFDCWDSLTIHDHTNMRADKMGRIEEPTWDPPYLEFDIERHGATVNGSTRASVYRWSVNLDTGVAKIIDEKRRQLSEMDARLDVKPIAAALADAIVKGKAHPHIVITKTGAAILWIGKIIPATNAWTTSSRKKRLRAHLATLIEPHGWKLVRPNTYALSMDGWIIELASSTPLYLIAIGSGGAFVWSPDKAKAIRFARREDAEKIGGRHRVSTAA